MKYEVTLTLKPHLYKQTAVEQHKRALKCLEDVLKPYRDKISMVAELTGEHNVHYHGMIELKDIKDKDRFLNRFRYWHHVFGRKSCNQVRFEDTYIAYMRKSLEQTKEILKFPIVNDSFNLFSISTFEESFEQTPTVLTFEDN